MSCQFPALGVWSFHARSRIHPERCRRVRFDVNVDSTQHSSCWLAVDAESPRSRIVNSSLSGASSRAKPAPALSWPDLRFLHLSLICSPLESVVPISTSFSVPFIFPTQSFVTIASASSGSFLQDPCCSGCRCLCLHPLQRLSPVAASCLGSSIHSAPCLLLSTILPFRYRPCSNTSSLLLPSTSNHDQLSQYLIQTIHFLGFSSSAGVVAVDCSHRVHLKAVIYLVRYLEPCIPYFSENSFFDASATCTPLLPYHAADTSHSAHHFAALRGGEQH